ncbi:Hypothetical protein BIBO2_2960 [Brucella sp. BO2]|uniref:hypothetical protein n=1 Tax=Brucella sp. BO2 TaxID=693750 RepID=UPI0001E44612|nr:hypothetical protein [Brucella sp. BO2]EFM58186.1 Hypothetical protein BIBO2_2960 [Brucella sp. BO2]QPN27626.1 hypothetical protein I5770_03005 [Brucella sp. BO2]
MQAHGYSSYCDKHKRTLARHGHPYQIGVKKADLKPYIAEIRTFLERNHHGKAQAVISDAWGRVVKDAQRFVDRANEGRPFISHGMQAYQAVLSLSREQDAETIGVLLIAMGFWYQDDPRFWKYDEGFRFQTVRMLLRLNPREAQYQWRNGKMERSRFRETPPKTIKALWSIIYSTGFISYGVEIAKRKAKAIEARRQRADRERAAFFGDAAKPTESQSSSVHAAGGAA